MAPQELAQHAATAEAGKTASSPLCNFPNLGFKTRHARSKAGAWHETVTQHQPEPWPAARLALQARICALGLM